MLVRVKTELTFRTEEHANFFILWVSSVVPGLEDPHLIKALLDMASAVDQTLQHGERN